MESHVYNSRERKAKYKMHESAGQSLIRCIEDTSPYTLSCLSFSFYNGRISQQEQDRSAKIIDS